MVVKKIAVITGGTSGIGLETAKALIKKDWFVYTVSRRNFNFFPEEKSFHFSSDITDETAVKTVFAKIWEREKRLDLLVCAAGFGISGAVEFTDIERAKKQFDVNFFGAFLSLRTAFPYMRMQGFGKILTVGSIAGEIAIPFQAFYSASKAALGKLVEAFNAEASPFGICCSLIMPGDVATPFTEIRNKSEEGNDIYGGRISRSISKMEKDEKGGMSAEKLGAFIAFLAEKKKLKFCYPYNGKYAFLLWLYRILPRSFALFLIKIIYAE
ncbi:SDR family NAD(P)-dependent oxidoreductase [Treponema pedis]|uniref:Short chain dehydrogenase/reductase family oxidoreductase n=1 Tax=Treponema pedis str. T A4 TaxID=1291379 RepID=S6A4Z8_9SPIR|nr:SDR family NAD(P)-dependent oxidoreductase [Treponema pedis]AGT44961.1 short chain dehydrogenase/reductase family oxidoreductase [Treponema pedis str. T A4]